MSSFTTQLSRKCEYTILDLSEMKEIFNLGGKDNPGICSCSMDRFFAIADIEKDKLRCFYLLGSLIDQTMFTHFQGIYQDFRSVLKFPKIYQHGCGMASPSIFFEVRKLKYSKKKQFEYEEVSKEVNWDTMKTVGENLFQDFKNWLKETNNESVISPFNDKIIQEINNKENNFLEPNKSKLLKLIKQIND